MLIHQDAEMSMKLIAWRASQQKATHVTILSLFERRSELA